jgi:predicted HAD superfamily Cof-like phosphohydrolase
MTGWQRDVLEFSRATGGTVGAWPDVRDRELRARLIAEEATETLSALGFDTYVEVWQPFSTAKEREVAKFERPGNVDLPALADGIVDTIYVLIGTAIAAGFDLAPVWDEVQRANMAKVDGPVREDGKRLKPPGWRPPDIEGVLRRQGWLPASELAPEREADDAAA